MKTLILVICCQLIVLFACSNNDQHKTNAAIADEDKKQKTPEVWGEYKRVTATNKDSLPYPECLVIIDGNKMSYEREGKELYIDSIYLDKKYTAKTFRFKNHTGDVMILTGEDDKELVIKRNANDGEYEYFRREQ